jgi:hypothetical protein
MPKHDYPLHPDQAQPYYTTIPVEEYEAMKRRIEVLLKINNTQREILERQMISVCEGLNGKTSIIYMDQDGAIIKEEEK